jgi:hypothetical protein
MPGEEKNVVDFHLKMDSEMKNMLKELPLYKRIQSLSGVIVRVIEILSPQMEKEYFKMKQRNSVYKLVNENLEIPRESVHAYLPDFQYAKLKSMHKELNLYSIAQLLRLMLRIFLLFYKRFGEVAFEKFKHIFQKWKQRCSSNKDWYKSLLQLFRFLYQKKDECCLFSIYNDKFIPIFIMRC